ncbi:low affinity iron permease family protein [Microvirga makkahensis]|nr:low affinity iron permease family protein [Microvirga makkahensis]
MIAISCVALCRSLCISSPIVFVLSLFLIVLWALGGPFFGFSDTWQPM